MPTETNNTETIILALAGLETECKYCEWDDSEKYDTPCETCQGTGKVPLIPGLRRECHGIQNGPELYGVHRGCGCSEAGLVPVSETEAVLIGEAYLSGLCHNGNRWSYTHIPISYRHIYSITNGAISRDRRLKQLSSENTRIQALAAAVLATQEKS